MTFFNGIYKTPDQPPINEESDVSIKLATHSTYTKVTKWAKWFVTFPIKCLYGVYNALLFSRQQDFLSVILQTYKGNAVTPMQVSFNSIHLVSSPKLIHEISSRHFRSDPNGLFETPNESSFLDLLQDIFPEYKKEISKDDFLFTCSREHTKDLRKPFIEFFLKKSARERMQTELAKVTQEVIDTLDDKTLNEISARELAETLSMAVLSRLFLDPTLSLKECQEIGRAASIAVNFRVMLSSNDTQKKEYEWAKVKLRKAIQSSRGEFVEFLHDANMSEIRIYGTLMLAYIAGSETTSTAMHTILWRLGQHLDIQNDINKDLSVLDTFVRDSLRMYTPVYLFTRVARKDLVITVKNKDNKDWEYPIAKGDRIMCSPYLAGKDEKSFPSSLTSQKKRMTSHQDRYPTKVFSEGPHKCPGMHLAEQEISSFVFALLQKYVITSTPNKPNLLVKGIFTLKPEEVWLRLTKRF